MVCNGFNNEQTEFGFLFHGILVADSIDGLYMYCHTVTVLMDQEIERQERNPGNLVNQIDTRFRDRHFQVFDLIQAKIQPIGNGGGG